MAAVSPIFAMENALAAWKHINLPELQKTLDVQSLALFSTQTASLESRKKLAEQTKDFKKNGAPTMADFKILLKEYQNEIDAINKRSKNAETAFLNLYKVFAEVPDPAIYIQRAMDQAAEVKALSSVAAENKRLAEQIEASKSAITTGKEKEEEVLQLKEKIAQYESLMETMVSDKVMEITMDLKADMEERIKVYKETEYSLNRQLNQVKDQFLSLQSTQEFAQVSSPNTDHFNENVAAKLAEMDILRMDLDKASGKVENLTKENFILKRQLKESQDDSKVHAIVEEWRQRNLDMEKEMRSLEDAIEASKATMDGQKHEYQAALQDLEREIAKCKVENARLATQLAEYTDYEEVKRELEIFRGIEAGEAVDDQNAPLERLVMEKNKKMENENTSLKMECATLTAALVESKKSQEDMQSQLAVKNNLIGRLEIDIQRLNELQSRAVQSPDHLQSLMADFQPNPNKAAAPAPTKPSSDASIVPILTSQRDRFKQRFEESHRNYLDLQSRLSSVQDELFRVQQDNVSLYEKLKYQENYRQTQSSVINMDGSPSRQYDAVSARYRDKYEATMDPFRQFKQEENRRAQVLNPADRIAMIITKLLTSNKYSRLVFVLYTGALHVLVFVALFELMAVSTSSKSQLYNNKPNRPDT
ncbi:hypothetical protein HDU91_006301 [Kappamyces sp. JEL0680]|nr:hypothetical protein HDU91_006301 [Kappamyces sp. JEL0680]